MVSKQTKNTIANLLAIGGAVLLVDSFMTWYETIFGAEPINSLVIGAILVLGSLIILN